MNVQQAIKAAIGKDYRARDLNVSEAEKLIAYLNKTEEGKNLLRTISFDKDVEDLLAKRKAAATSKPKPVEKRQDVATLHIGKGSNGHGYSGKARYSENKKGTNIMQLTTARLKQIIKEELEAIVSEMEPEEEVLSPEEERVASLEQQLAEAKKKAAKTKAMKQMKGDANAHKSAKSAMKTLGKKGK